MGKPIKEDFTPDPLHSFRLNHSVQNNLDSPWHNHEHYELFYIIKSHGIRFIGDNIDNFYDGDLAFLGIGLPHVWKNPKSYYQNNDLKIEAICLQFKENAFGESFFTLPELIHIRDFLNRSAQGFMILGQTKTRIINLLHEMLECAGMMRLLKLFEILNILAASPDLLQITQSSQDWSSFRSSDKRLVKVFDLVSTQFQREISLEEAASAASLSKAAFCRLFKKVTLKSFVDYLNFVRIRVASELLESSELSIAEIGYKCGFRNQSYFNYIFRRVNGHTPTDHRKRMNMNKHK
jgi:AraC-like DNA-binding protein